MAVPTLIVSGTFGAGKTTITAEINDVLAEAEVPNAAVDLDALIWQWPPSSRFNSDLMFENLAALWLNYAAHGADRLILARVIENRAELTRHRAAVPGADIIVCRLVAQETLQIGRLRERMASGPALDWHEARTVELESVLAQAEVEDFVVAPDDRTPREVALEVLAAAGWL